MSTKDYGAIPTKDTIDSVMKAMQKRGFDVVLTKDKAQALEEVKSSLPADAEVMAGSSTTLHQIGVMEYLQDTSAKLNYVGAKIWSENDEALRHKMRRNATAAEYFLASVNAITNDGRLVAVDQSGSRVSAFPFAAGHVLIVVGVNKIAGDLTDAMKRIESYVFPRENERAEEAYGMSSSFGKWVIIDKEIVAGRIKVILVEEELGY